MMMLAILIVSLLAVSAVSAADNSTSDVVSVEETTDDVVSVEMDNQVIESVDVGIGNLSASSDGSFSDLASDIANANGELKLTRNYVYDSTADSNYKNGIEINKELTINGKGFIINGKNTARAFIVSSGNVVLRNIEFTNCSSSSSSSSSGSGGAVYWAGSDGSLFNCCFEDCYNSQHNSYSNSFYSDSLFKGTSSKSTSNSYSSGGAVYWGGSDGSLFDCDFINCYSYSYSYSSNKIYNSYRDLSACSISSSSYSYDSVYWAGKNGNLVDCSFINSTSGSASSSKSTSRSESYAGGFGTSANDPILYFYSYSYSNSYSYGGAVYWAGDDGNLSDCNFITPNSKPSSSSSGSGGAVYWYGTDGGLSNCNFMNCSIPSGGYANAVYWYGANGGLLNCSFVDCNSSSSSGYNGSVYWSGTNGELFNCSFNGDYYNYENYCSKSSSSTVYPVMLIHTSHNFNNDGSIVIFECTQLVNNISVTLYNVTSRKVLYDEFDISSDDLTSSYTVNYLEGGEYQMVLHYGGDNFYTSTSTNNLFKALYKSSIELNLKNNYIFDEKIPLNYTIAPNCAGIISIYIDNTFKANISVGDAFEFETLDAGEYDITVIYNGDANFAKSNDSCILKVSKVDPSIDVKSSNLLGNVSFVIGLNETATGNVTLIINDINSYHGNLTNGKTNIIVPNLNVGDYSIKIIYNGCKNYNNKTYVTILTIDKIPTTVTATVDDITYTENATINVKGGVEGIAIVKIDETYIKNINVIANTIVPVTFENIPVGKHNVTVTLKPTNTDYNESKYNTDFTVSKKESSFNLNVVNSVYGEDVIVNVTANEDGKVILKVGGIIREKNVLANTLTKINLGVLAVSSYNVEVSFDAGENYKPSTKNDNIVISPAKAEIQILQAENNVYGENTIIKVKTNIEGTLTFNVGSITKSFDIVANKLTSFNLGILDAKTYAVEVNLDAGNNYTKPIDTTQVTIESKQTTVNVDVKNSTYGEKVIVNVVASENGEISVNIGDITKCVNVEANKAYSVDFSVLNVNSYNVYVTFDGGNNYKKSYNNAFLTVSPAKSQITEIQAPNNVYGKNTMIRVKANVGGVLTASINAITKEVNLNANQLTSIDFGILDANNYEVELSFNAGNNYIPTTATKTFKVLKTDPTISIAVTNATYGQKATIVVNSNAEGNATIDIGVVKTYNNVLFKNNKIVQDVIDIDAGSYSVKVTYNGNNNYNAKTYDAKLTINKAPTSVVGTVEDIDYTQNAVINVKGSADGIAVVKIDENYIKNVNVLANTVAQVTFENIYSGKHNVTITLKPTNNNYDESTYNTEFTVSKKDASVSLNVVDSIYGEDAIVNVIAGEDGKVVLKVGDITREKNVLANTLTKFNLGVLAVNAYNVEVSFDAGENYNVVNKQSTFTVTPAKSEISSIQAQNNIYGENTIINVKTNVSGVLTVKINNNEKTFNIDANKLTSLDLDKYDAGTYNIDLSLDAGANYTQATGNTKVTINPKQTTVSLDTNDEVYGNNVVVKVTASEKGKVTVQIGNIVKSVNVDANKVTSVDFGILDVNSYEVIATFDGGKNFNTSSDKDSFEISPKASSVTFVNLVNNYIYSNNVVVNVKSDVAGTVTVKVGDKTQTKQITAGNVVSFDFGILDVNKYDVFVSLNAGSNYISSQNTASITISPKSTVVTLNTRDYDADEKVIVNVTASENGKATIKLGNVIKNVDVMANKIISVDFGILDCGSYDVVATFAAGSNYIDSSDSANIKVLAKIDEKDIDISIPEIKPNQENNIVINLPADATGTVTLIIGENAYTFNVKNGIANINMPKLDEGNYKYVINYSGDSKYSSFENTGSIDVAKPDPEIVIPPLDKPSEDGSVAIKLPSDATGTVTLVINGKAYSFPVINGVANVYMPELNAGNYNYSITYSGDGKYSPFTNVGSMNVVLSILKITAPSVTTVYNGGKYVVVTLTDKNDNPISGLAVSITLNGKTYSSITNKNGQVKLSTNGLAPKSYTAKVSFAGNTNYIGASKSFKVAVKKATPKLTAKAKTFKKSVKTKKYTVTLKTNQNKVMKNTKVSLKVNGKTYSATTNAKGQATFKITKLTKKGKFTAVVKFAGNKYYNAKTVNAKITVK